MNKIKYTINLDNCDINEINRFFDFLVNEPDFEYDKEIKDNIMTIFNKEIPDDDEQL